jgi:hypothetical protein
LLSEAQCEEDLGKEVAGWAGTQLWANWKNTACIAASSTQNTILLNISQGFLSLVHIQKTIYLKTRSALLFSIPQLHRLQALGSNE